MNIDVSNFKFIDEDNNAYIIGSLATLDSEKYALMVNIEDESDNFIAKLSNSSDAINLDIIEDQELISKILEKLSIV